MNQEAKGKHKRKKNGKKVEQFNRKFTKEITEVANKYFKKSSTLLVISEKQIKIP